MHNSIFSELLSIVAALIDQTEAQAVAPAQLLTLQNRIRLLQASVEANPGRMLVTTKK